MLPMDINRVAALALVDSGASATMISRAVYDKMTRAYIPSFHDHLEVTEEGGKRVGLLGEVRAGMQIAGQPRYKWFTLTSWRGIFPTSGKH